MADPWDMFPDAPAQNAGPLHITVHPSGNGDPWDAFPDAPAQASGSPQPHASSASSVISDVLKSIPSGVARGVAGMVGLPGDLGRLMKQQADSWLGPSPDIGGKPFTSEQVQHGIEAVTGPLHNPETTAGRFADTVAQFAPAAVMPVGGAVKAASVPVNAARNLVNFAVVPGVASEAAGRAFEGAPVERYVRGATAMAAGGAAAVLNRPSTVVGNIARAAEGVTPQQMQAAERLFNDAQAMGVPITRYEAIQYATGGATRFGDLQRVIEGQGGMKEFFAQRPAQVEAAGRRALDTIAPAPAAPSTTGPAAGAAAEGVLNDVRGTINRVAEPFYTAAEKVRLAPAEFARVEALPGYQEAVRAVRGDPQLNRYVAGLPDDSVGFLNEVKKYFDQAAANARSPMAQNPNMQRSAGYGRDAADVRGAAVNASPDYAQALAIEEQGRRQYLEPMMRGLIGKIAKHDVTTRQAIDALFPRNPLPNSQNEIATAIRALSHSKPAVAREMVRVYAESVFNQATRDLQGGPNQWGGAGFAAAMRGNSQQASNLRAAITSLPNGQNIWPGFSRFLDIMEAQGQRQRIGSQTSFNTELLGELKRGTPLGEAMTMTAGVGIRLPARIQEGVERLRLGQSVGGLARLATDPRAGEAFAKFAAAPVGSNEFYSALAKILFVGFQPRTQARDKLQ